MPCSVNARSTRVAPDDRHARARPGPPHGRARREGRRVRGPGRRADGDDVCARHELRASSSASSRACLGVDGIRLRDGDDTVLDPEQPQDGEVLMRLRACPLSCVDDEQEEVDPVAPRRSSARTARGGRRRRLQLRADRPEARAARSRGRWRSAPLLLWQPVVSFPVSARTKPRLAVVDVPAVPTVSGIRVA